MDPIVFQEIRIIEKIIRDETWLEGERRGCPVSPRDPVVCENVCKIILRIGAELRRELSKQAKTSFDCPCQQERRAA